MKDRWAAACAREWERSERGRRSAWERLPPANETLSRVRLLIVFEDFDWLRRAFKVRKPRFLGISAFRLVPDPYMFGLFEQQ
jgi:hypothetical protein